jgi:hypothetical protein
MTRSAHDRAGILILRCWTEGPPATGLRVRIVATGDLDATERPVTVVTDAASAGAAVCAWLEGFIAEAPAPPDPGDAAVTGP